MGVLDVWYFTIDAAETMIETVEDETARERAKKRFAKARERNVLDEDFPEMRALRGRHAPHSRQSAVNLSPPGRGRDSNRNARARHV